MTKNNKGNLFVFELGPSVKFVSAIKDAIFNNKNASFERCFTIFQTLIKMSSMRIGQTSDSPESLYLPKNKQINQND